MTPSLRIRLARRGGQASVQSCLSLTAQIHSESPLSSSVDDTNPPTILYHARELAVRRYVFTARGRHCEQSPTVRRQCADHALFLRSVTKRAILGNTLRTFPCSECKRPTLRQSGHVHATRRTAAYTKRRRLARTRPRHRPTGAGPDRGTQRVGGWSATKGRRVRCRRTMPAGHACPSVTSRPDFRSQRRLPGERSMAAKGATATMRGWCQSGVASTTRRAPSSAVATNRDV